MAMVGYVLGDETPIVILKNRALAPGDVQIQGPRDYQKSLKGHWKAIKEE